jgi:hypothetical protein
MSIMKKSTNESITKKSANLDEIVNNVDEMDALLRSREFLTTLVNDLINNKRNIIEWKLVDGNGSVSDVDSQELKDTFGVEYSFDFKYNYQGKTLMMTLFVSGEVPFKVSPVRSGNYFTPPEGGEVSVDYKNMGKELDLSLFDQDGSEIDISWLTPELEEKLTKQILQDYI